MFQKHQIYTLITLYRWLVLLPPGIGLLLNRPDRGWLIALAGLALLNTLIQTGLFFKLRSSLHRDFTYEDKPTYAGKLPLLFLIFELLVATLLNTSPDNSYYLYSLAPLFAAAFFYGLPGAMLGALVLGASYTAARVSAWLVSSENSNPFNVLANLVGFFLIAALAGYLLKVLEQLRQYAAVIRRYQGNLERQNQSLERTNQHLEYLSDFSRVLQGGHTPAQIEQLSLQYFTRLLINRRAHFETHPQRLGQVQIVKDETDLDWLAPKGSAATGGHSNAAPDPSTSTDTLKVTRKDQSYWLVPLIYQGERFGLLALPNATDYHTNQANSEQEEKLLVSLLADQLARVLGSLKQTQALAVEAERARLAMDMHDVVAQSLFGIAYNLDACLKLLDRDPAGSKQRLSDLRGLAFDTLSSVRAIIYDLWNEETGESDFAQFLQAYLKKAARLYPFKIRLEIQGPPGGGQADFKLDQESQKNLYRLVQEALSNAAKHSGATEVLIELRRTGAGLNLEIRDNGCGFKPEQLPFSLSPGTMPTRSGQSQAAPSPVTTGGVGLVAMRERAEQIGAKLIVESKPDQGTRIAVNLPLAA